MKQDLTKANLETIGRALRAYSSFRMNAREVEEMSRQVESWLDRGYGLAKIEELNGVTWVAREIMSGLQVSKRLTLAEITAARVNIQFLTVIDLFHQIENEVEGGKQ